MTLGQTESTPAADFMLHTFSHQFHLLHEKISPMVPLLTDSETTIQAIKNLKIQKFFIMIASSMLNFAY